MQIRLTVLGPPLGGHAAHACDVLVTAPAGTALAGVASGLAAALAAAGSDLGSGAVVVFAGQERLDAQRCALGEPPLIDGAVLSLGAPADPERHAGPPLAGTPRLHVVSGPDAGGVHLLHGGEVRVGRSSSADVPVDDPDVSRLHCAVTLGDDGRVTLHDLGSTNGTTLDTTPVDDRPVPFRPGALLRAGESTLVLHGPDTPAPAGEGPDLLPTSPDGEGRLRVTPRTGDAGARGGHRSAGGRESAGERRGADGPSAWDTRAPGGPVAGAEAPGSFPGPTGYATGSGHGQRTPGTGGTDGPHGTAAERAPEWSAPARTEGARGRGAVGPQWSGRSGHSDHEAGAHPGERARSRTPEDDPRGVPARTAGQGGPEGRAAGQPHDSGAPGGPEGRTTAHRGVVPPRDPAATAPRTGEPEERTPPSGTRTPPQRTEDGGPRGTTSPWNASMPAPGTDVDGTGGTAPAWGTRSPVYRTGAGAAAPYPHSAGAQGDAAGSVTTVDGPGGVPLRAPQQRTDEPSWTAAATAPEDDVARPADTATALGTARIHPAPGPADAPPAPDAKRPRNRGIAAWARRLAGGRGGQQPRSEDDSGPGAVPSPRAPATVETAAALRERWPDPAAVLLTALGPGPRLWERGPDHPDLLTVRLGTADRYVPGPHGGEGVLLPAVPVTVGLRQAGSLGLAGPRVRLAGLARSVLSQLAALHSPSVLEYVLIAADPLRTAAERQAEWAWLGWLPQLRPAHGQDCRLLVAHDREQAAARTAELVRRLDDGPLGPSWPTAPEEKVAALAEAHRGPRTVVVVDGDPGTPALRESLARLAARGGAAGIHLVCLADAPSTTASSPVSAALETARAVSPAFPHCGAVALLSGDVATVVQVIGNAPRGGADVPPPGSTVVAALDAVSGAWAERFARALAPLRVADAAEGDARSARVAALPRTARLLDELGLARATPASLTARWASATDPGSRPGGRAVAVLGAGPHGPLSVDLAADGPHLLVEGGPGSGKTELLRSLAASLAAADRPDRLSLVLVDGAASERGEGLRMCTDLPHVSTYLAAADPLRMREFAQALGSELKRRAELLGTLDFAAWHERHSPPPPQVVPPRASGDLEPAATGTLKLRAARADGPAHTTENALPRLVVLVDDLDALVAPALGSTGRPAAGSVVRALDAVAREGERLGIHLVAASGRPDRTADTAVAERAALRAALEIAPASDGGGATDGPAPGRGRLHRAGAVTPFQAGRVTGRIPRTATQRPTVVTLDWQRMGDPPTRRPLRELGNGPTDLALLASALQRAAQSAGAVAAPPLL
ncbi:FHA domain-containing protein [Streptomyces sp. AV19]|uniref:FtsK/SpoIIIE domain-containing protein n=1 Tax=Streptomyces sp. AV19 TaxID=2793068 RepID=UPI0018FE06D7|nr:FtsK/SpoIIIE domain-containing protein [Streptomyces sp. AV19]MBH1932749.1 FHA domain-containing protein [Streptomyces sp. AV19]MDG4531420.1 FtsK/SpoIIIE domain-containing protein [Streptomyces sp. AV19]